MTEHYNRAMARGWESKSVEAQQEDAVSRSSSRKPRLAPEEAALLRERESLRLSLKSIVEQLDRTRDARRRAMLEQARTELEQELEQMIRTIGS
jgi:hypothetical protein